MKTKIEQLQANIKQVRIEQNEMDQQPITGKYVPSTNTKAVTNMISQFLCRLADHEGQKWDEKKKEWIPVKTVKSGNWLIP